jgi:peptidoglycan/LPS O-acetylase OafA/YrhL
MFAKRIREPLQVTTDKPDISRFRFDLAAFILTILFFLTAWVLPNFGQPPILPILLFGIIVWAGGLWIWRMSRRGNWRSPQMAALASGTLLFFILLAPLVEMDKTRVDDPSGMTLVGLAALILLILFNRHIQKLERPEDIAN